MKNLLFLICLIGCSACLTPEEREQRFYDRNLILDPETVDYIDSCNHRDGDIAFYSPPKYSLHIINEVDTQGNLTFGEWDSTPSMLIIDTSHSELFFHTEPINTYSWTLIPDWLPHDSMDVSMWYPSKDIQYNKRVHREQYQDSQENMMLQLIGLYERYEYWNEQFTYTDTIHWMFGPNNYDEQVVEYHKEPTLEGFIDWMRSNIQDYE